jgi:CheY-like chemotaxis protein
MSPENARVFVAEDDADFQLIIRTSLEEEGHKVVIAATTRKEALEDVKYLKDLGIQIGIIDGNLSGSKSGKDGRDLIRAIRETKSGIITIGISGNKLPEADFDFGKDNLNSLGKFITNI